MIDPNMMAGIEGRQMRPENFDPAWEESGGDQQAQPIAPPENAVSTGAKPVLPVGAASAGVNDTDVPEGYVTADEEEELRTGLDT